MSRNPDRKKRRQEYAEHAHNVYNLRREKLDAYFKQRVEQLAHTTTQLAQTTQEFKRDQLRVKKALQARQRRLLAKVQKEAKSQAEFDENTARVRSNIARDPKRSKQIERYRARRKRIIESVLGHDLEEDEARSDDESGAESDDSSWMVDDDEIDEKTKAQLNVIRRMFSSGIIEGGKALKEAASGLPPPPKIDESEFHTAPGDAFAKNPDDMDEDDEAIASSEGAAAAAAAAPAKRRVALHTVARFEGNVNPQFYVPPAAPFNEKETLAVNNLRVLSPGDIVELIMDVKGEIEERERGRHNAESRWDLRGFSDKVLHSVLQHVLSLQEMYYCGLISTEAKPQMATGIGAMFSRLFFS
jgi:hypothetical protein